jgi:hypothetical protein
MSILDAAFTGTCMKNIQCPHHLSEAGVIKMTFTLVYLMPFPELKIDAHAHVYSLQVMQVLVSGEVKAVMSLTSLPSVEGRVPCWNGSCGLGWSPSAGG